MNHLEAERYRLNLKEHLKGKPREKKALFLQQVKAGGEYKDARDTVRQARGRTIFDAAKIDSESRIGKKEGLTPQQQAIHWASQQLEQFRGTAPLDSKKRGKIINMSSTYLLGHTEFFDVIAETWTNQLATSLVVDEKTPGFMEQMIEATRHNAERNWVGLKHERLAHVVKSLTYTDEAKPLAKSALQGYFQGPRNRRDTVRAYSRFAEATMDLFEHPEAFENGVSIGVWRNEDILSRRSKFYRDLIITSEMTIDNDELLRQAYVADNIMLNLTILTKISPKEVVESAERFGRTDSEFKVEVEREFYRLSRKLDRSEISKRISAISLLKKRPKSFLDSKEQSAEDFVSEWPAKLLFDRSFPLRARYEEEFGPLIAVRQYIAENVKPKYLSEGLGNVVHVPIILPNNRVLDIFVPQSLQDKKVEIVKQFLKVEDLQTPADGQLGSLVSLETGYLEFQDIQINYTTRLRSKLEQKHHPLTMLEHVGFPMPQLEPDKNIQEINRQKAQKILCEQVRFLQPRRIRIPIANKQLTSLGYKYVDFSRIPKSDNFRADICLVNQTYSIIFNENLQLDLEEKTFTNRDLLESIHYTLLTLLEPLLTKETEGRGFSTTEKEAGKVVSRIGYIKRLHKGSYSQSAIDNYRKYEKKDLVEKISELQRVTGSSQNRTYVKPVISDGDEELSPIVCHVPQEDLENLK